MAILVFKLRNVPEEEAEAIRQLLNQHHISWHETSSGNWGIAMPGIWVNDDHDMARARQLIEQFQEKHQRLQRERYLQNLEKGTAPTLVSQWQRHPLRMLGIVAFCLFILYATINPFLQLIGMSADSQ